MLSLASAIYFAKRSVSRLTRSLFPLEPRVVICFVNGIRKMLENHILNPSLNNTNRDCSESKLCIIKSDFIKYSYSDKYNAGKIHYVLTFHIYFYLLIRLRGDTQPGYTYGHEHRRRIVVYYSIRKDTKLFFELLVR